MAKKGQLTGKQQEFVKAYCGAYGMEYYGDASKSALKAGYNTPNSRIIGHELLGKPHVAKAVEEMRNEMEAEQARVTREMQIDLKKEFAKIALDLSERTGDRLRALELIGKMDGAFVTKVEQTTKVENPLDNMSEDDLEQMINKLSVQ